MRSISLFSCLALLTCCGCLRPTATTSKRPARSSPQVSSIISRITATTDNILRNRALSNEVHAAWQVLHGVLAYPQDFSIHTVNGMQQALPYLLSGQTLDGWSFQQGSELPSGRFGIRAEMDAGSYAGQGHADQWFAVLSQAGLQLDQEMIVKGERYILEDFLAQTKLDVCSNIEMEWSWTLVGLSRYLSTSDSWIAADGTTWSMERLVQYEIEQAINGSACGGTHRLIGIAMTLDKRRREGGSINAVWLEADSLLQDAIATAQQFQNSDGSFSSNYFARPGISVDTAKVLETTGHTVELLALALPRERLTEPWMLQAIQRLCDLLDAAEDMPLECGALYHAVHGLKVFETRVSET